MYRLLGYLFEILLMFVLYAICDTGGMKKYIFVIAVSMIYLIFGRKKKWSADAIISISLPAATYLTIGCINSLIHANVYATTIKVVAFWIIPVLFAFALYVFYGEHMPHIVDMQFIGSCLAYSITNARFLIRTFNVESTFAFAFGVFFIYYIYKRKWSFCGIAALFLYFSDKRIAVLAVMAAVLVMGLLWLFRNDKKLASTIWAIVIAAVNGYLWLIYSGTLECFCKGIGINTNGRVKIYGQMTEWFGNSALLIGKGLGIVEKLLEFWKMKAFANLHNDLLKFYIELGIWGLLIFLFSYGVMFYIVEKKFGNKKMSFFVSMAIYSVLLFATDNVSIYILYLIPVYSVFFAVLSEKQKS